MSPSTRALAHALIRWQHAAGPYWPYVCAAPFFGTLTTSPPSAPKTSLTSDLIRALDGLPSALRTAVFLDLPVTRTLAETPALESIGFRIVPVIQRWVASKAALPCEPLLEQLVACQPSRLKAREDRGVVFVLDGERAGPIDTGMRARSSQRFNNRYSYRICRFPPARFLQQDGITAVRWISSSGIAPDLRSYADGLANAGLTIEQIDSPACLTS